jgi:hypothetical protein
MDFFAAAASRKSRSLTVLKYAQFPLSDSMGTSTGLALSVTAKTEPLSASLLLHTNILNSIFGQVAYGLQILDSIGRAGDSFLVLAGMYGTPQSQAASTVVPLWLNRIGPRRRAVAAWIRFGGWLVLP